MSIRTREKIKEAAIEMFNEKCATNVSTVQLSERLHISPGNLYYYYDNKEHLIKSIWEEDVSPIVGKLFSREDFGHSENGILNLLNDYSKIIYKYKFFYAEIFALLNNDPSLMELYIKHMDEIKQRMNNVFDSWIETGIMNPIDESSRKLLSDNMWIVVQTWINFSGLITGKSDIDSAVRNTIIHTYAVFAPYFTDQACERMKTLIKSRGFLDGTDLDEL